MELRQLYYFLKIAEYENITKASEELLIAQPHLTRQLRSLEEELGVTLFLREKKRIHITDEGRFLKQQAEQLLSFAQKTKDQVAEMGSGVSGVLYIGSVETVGTVYLPEWITGFKSNYPNVRYNLWSGNSNDVIERLEKGLIDIALVRTPFDESKFEHIPILTEEWSVLLNKNHKLAKNDKREISLKELAREDLLVPTQRVDEVTDWFVEYGLDCNIECGYSPLMNAIVMVQSNLGVAILPDSCHNLLHTDDVVVKHFKEKKYTNVSFVWRKHSELPSTAKHFLDYVKSTTSK